MSESPAVLAAAPDRARHQLEHTIFPFWLSRGVDHAFGGFHTCFDNRGRTRTSTDKFTWSQGRFVWLLARAADLARRGLLALDPDDLLSLAERGARFLLEHAVTPDGTCAFRLRRDGSAAGEGPARSVYADCFVVMGFAELARATGQRRWLDHAAAILARARADIHAGTAPTPPYEVPAGHRPFGPEMILLNTLLVEVGAARTVGGADRGDWLAEALDRVLSHRLPDGTFAEMRADGAESLLTRHRVPGHAIEGMWVALDALELLGHHEGEERRALVLDSVPVLCALGWDHRDGGLLRYTDATGPQCPDGKSGDSPYEQLVLRTWDTKLWWVHTEAAATTAIAALRYGSRPAAEWFATIWDYTLRTFPGGDDGEEWIQIRDRAGRPLDEVVALPVKDPFHVARNLMQLVELGADGGAVPTDGALQ